MSAHLRKVVTPTTRVVHVAYVDSGVTACGRVPDGWDTPPWIDQLAVGCRDCRTAVVEWMMGL